MATRTEQDAAAEILEQGDIYFVYRPKVRPEGQEEEVATEGLGDVENFYLILKPEGGAFRLINIGRKRLPEIEEHERNWGFVDTIAKSGKEIEQTLQRETHETRTRGRARPAGGAPGRRGGLRPGSRGR